MLLIRMRLRVMTYNILVGGVGPQGLDRTAELLQVIEAARPDVVAIEEAQGFLPEERGTLYAYARRLGMTGVIGRSDSKLHLACLARPELDVRLERHIAAPFRHGALHVSIAARWGRLPLVIVHLNPFVEDARLEEIEYLLGALPSGPALLTGDFNGLSPQDVYPVERISDFLQQYRVTPASKSLGNPLPSRAENRAMSRLLEAGWVDLGHACAGADRSPTYPTPCAPDPEGPPIRIDYVLASPALAGAAVSCEVPRGSPADRASDHFPVVVELELDRVA